MNQAVKARQVVVILVARLTLYIGIGDGNLHGHWAINRPLRKISQKLKTIHDVPRKASYRSIV